MRSPEEGAQQAREAGRAIADLVYEKQLAYGDASGIQHQIWKALLAQYERPVDRSYDHGSAVVEQHNVYVIPQALMDHIPRLTRVFDRICRIVSNPASDRLGEDPWRDLAGDAICGIVMPRTRAAERHPEPLTIHETDNGQVSPFVPGPAPCPRCASREWKWVDNVNTRCSDCTKHEPKSLVLTFARMHTVRWASEKERHEFHNSRLGLFLDQQIGEDPIEAVPDATSDPKPHETRYWNEEDKAVVAEIERRKEARAMADSQLEEFLASRRAEK